MTESKTEEQKKQEYVDAVNKLGEKHGYTIAPIPGWRFSQDGNDYRLVIEMQVIKIPEKK